MWLPQTQRGSRAAEAVSGGEEFTCGLRDAHVPACSPEFRISFFSITVNYQFRICSSVFETDLFSEERWSQR